MNRRVKAAALVLIAAQCGAGADPLPSVAERPREYLIGVNIAGGEFWDRTRTQDPNYGWPSEKTLDYFAGKRLSSRRPTGRRATIGLAAARRMSSARTAGRPASTKARIGRR